jgi:hypothetical protein
VLGAVDRIDLEEVVDRIDLDLDLVVDHIGLEEVVGRIVPVLDRAAVRTGLARVAVHIDLDRVVGHTAPDPVQVVDRTGSGVVVRKLLGEVVQVEEVLQEALRTAIQTEVEIRIDLGFDQADRIVQVEHRNIPQLQSMRHIVLVEVVVRNSAEVDRIVPEEAEKRRIHQLHRQVVHIRLLLLVGDLRRGRALQRLGLLVLNRQSDPHAMVICLSPSLAANPIVLDVMSVVDWYKKCMRRV